MSDTHYGLSSQEKEVLTNIVNNAPFTSVWGSSNRCTYCKYCIMCVCTKGVKHKNSIRCDEFEILDYLDAPSICKLCMYATMKYTCNDKHMQIAVPFCMKDKFNPIKIGLTSKACNNFKSCLEVNDK